MKKRTEKPLFLPELMIVLLLFATSYCAVTFFNLLLNFLYTLPFPVFIAFLFLCGLLEIFCLKKIISDNVIPYFKERKRRKQ